jgi:lipoyl(octanoyl) transferase
LISIVQLGTIDYALGLRLQQQLVALRKEEKIGDVLLLLEHSPVITLGRNAKESNIIASPGLLAQRGVELFETDRGGDVTFHSPGQIVGYPIFDLRGFARSSENSQSMSSRAESPTLSSRAEENDPLADRSLKSRDLMFSPRPLRRHLGAVDFVRLLEEVLIRTCADFGLPTKRVPGLTGVWTDEGTSNAHVGTAASAVPPSEARSEAKLAAIGIHISRFVTSHGFALNVNNDLSYFDLIIPCGIASKPVTSMQKELRRPLDLNSVAESISRNCGVVFQSQMLWVDTLDALLGRTVGVPLQAPNEFRQLHKEDNNRWA